MVKITSKSVSGTIAPLRIAVPSSLVPAPSGPARRATSAGVELLLLSCLGLVAATLGLTALIRRG